MKSLTVDIGWNGLTRPGDATDHFAMKHLPPFSPDTGEFSLANAFWLSEISRLIYRRSNGEGNVNCTGPSRDEILKRVGLRETLFLSRQETQCALIRTVPHQRPPFAVLVFRGTTGLRNWFLDLDIRPEQFAPRTVAHRGFVEALHHVWPALQSQLDKLAEPLFMTGHSMGGALAQLAAWYHPPRAVYSFGAPRVRRCRIFRTHGIGAHLSPCEWPRCGRRLAPLYPTAFLSCRRPHGSHRPQGPYM